MRAVIPVAGIGTRLKPFTHTTPKVLLNVAGSPILGHIIKKLLKQNITKATFVTGYFSDQIKAYVTSSFPELDAAFVQQETLLGLGHAIYTALPTVDDEEILIILGDTVFELDLSRMIDQPENVLGVKEVEDPRRFGVALVQDGRITKLIEKPQEPVSNLALVGLYYIRDTKLLSESLQYIVENEIRTRGEYQLTDALQIMIERGAVFTPFSIDGWYDCGKPETLLSTNSILLKEHKVFPEIPSVIIIPPVHIAKSATILNAIIGPFTTIDEDVIIENSIIKNSIIGYDAEIHNTMLDSSIVGPKTVIRGTFKRLNTGDSTEIEFY